MTRLERLRRKSSGAGIRTPINSSKNCGPAIGRPRITLVLYPPQNVCQRLSETCYNIVTMSLRIFAVFLLLLGFHAADAAPLGLSVMPGAHTVLTQSNSARCEFGTRQLSDETPLTHTFFLHNTTKKSLTIERVAVSCDCVQVFIGETQSLPVKIVPGQTIPVQVTVATRRLMPGPVSKSAWLYPHGSGDASLCLEMCGTVHDDSLQDNSASAKSNARSASVSANH
jgi:hypothetical protein